MGNKVQQKQLLIVEAAKQIIIERGYSQFSMRKVAVAAQMSLGNLNYYYPNKNALISDLLDFVIQSYVAEFDKTTLDAELTPEEQFEKIVHFIIDDIGTKETTIFFPELWALANHDQMVADKTEQLYLKARQVFMDLIPLINPSLSKKSVGELTLFISSSLEGLTPFVGYKKAWDHKLVDMKKIAIMSFLPLIKSYG